jgi:hypothetical protein
MNDLDLPPRRALPPEVQYRIRSRVREEMDSRDRRRWAVPVGVAASVAAVVGGAVLIGDGPARHSPAAPGTPWAAELDRCWAAVEHKDQAERVPARDDWRVLFSRALDVTRVTGIRAGGRTLFCETSLTSVSLSVSADPDPLPDGVAAQGAMTTPNGTVIGYAAPGVKSVTVMTKDAVGTGLTGKPAQLVSRDAWVRDGIFVAELAHNDLTSLDLTAMVYRADHSSDEITLSTPEPLLYEVDRPPHRADHHSGQARAALACLDEPGNGGGPVVDAGTWRLGVRFDQHFTGKGRAADLDLAFLVATNERATAVCTTSPSWSVRFAPAPGAATSPRRPVAPVMGGPYSTGTVLAGVTAAGVARLQLAADGHTVAVEVHDRTFAAFVPGTRAQDGTPGEVSTITVTAYDDAGGVLYRGSLPEIPKDAAPLW